MTPLEQMGTVLRELIESRIAITNGNIVRHAAEEHGECIGAYNKYIESRGSLGHFAQEWAQATLMLTMVGQQLLSSEQMESALDEEMERQHRLWTSPEFEDLWAQVPKHDEILALIASVIDADNGMSARERLRGVEMALETRRRLTVEEISQMKELASWA
jgi:hypothetical protein